MDPTQELQANVAAALAGYVDTRIRMAWETYDWPFSRGLEARVYADRWDEIDADDLFVGDVVFHLGGYWMALTDDPADEPSDESDEWQSASPTRRVIGLDQPLQTPISEVLDVWTADPAGSETARRLDFTLGPDGIELGACAPNEVWVSFSRRVARFTAELWDPAKAYAEGALVYYPEAEDCFICLAANTNVAPPLGALSSAKWQRQELPYELAVYAEFGAWADALAEDEKDDKSARREARAEEALANEYDKVQVKQKQTKRFRVLGR